MTDTVHASRLTLVACLFASLALHAALLVLLPGWTVALPEPAVPVLDVVMVAAEPPAVAPVPAAIPQDPKIPSPVADSPKVPRIAAAPLPRAAVQIPAADAAPPANVEVAPPADSRVAARVDTPAAQPATVTPPAYNAAYLRNPPPRYPLAARRNGDEGRVMLKVLVNTEGAPVRIELDQSSGSSLLDDAALEAVRGWRFVPARRGVQNVEGWVRVPLVFRLES
ncbi:MAG: energy transducer TonB [Burkholderiales bacterium]|nr:energy transducer TonB [Burkholderiales bacterium]